MPSNELSAALAHHRAGRYAAAIAIYNSLLRGEPRNAHVLQLLGAAETQTGEVQAAVGHLRESLEIQPDSPAALTNLGEALRRLKQTEAARAAFERALEIAPDAHRTHNNLGCLHLDDKRLDAAEGCFQRALDIEPDYVDALINLAKVFREGGRLAEAESVCRRAVKADTTSAEAFAQLGDVLRRSGDESAALEAIATAARLDPENAAAQTAAGRAYLTDQKHDLAIAAFQRAVTLQPESSAARRYLAVALREQGDRPAALAHFGRLADNPEAQLEAATTLPAIYRNVQEITDTREQVVEQLDRLYASGVRLNPLTCAPPTPFYLAYQGFNDRDIQVQIARLFEPAAPDLTADRADIDRSDGRIRVGFVSSYLCAHTIGHLNRGVIGSLNRDRFHVTVFHQSSANDAVTQWLRKRVDSFIELPPKLADARRAILQHSPDLLHYTDLGMSNRSLALARARMAPVQSVTWGHPTTSGFPTLDWFISSRHLESDCVAECYTEQPVLMESLGNFYYRPQAPARARSWYGLPDDRNLYGVLQSLFKIHPDSDRLFGEILRRDPDGIICLLLGHSESWREQLLRRFYRTIPDVADRIHFIPRQSRNDFVALNACFDALLDSVHFGGGNTSYEAFSFGTPIVTLPSEFLKGRITYAQYQKMGIDDCIASSGEDYIDIAVRLATDRDFRQSVHERIVEASPTLYGDRQAVQEYEQFFEQAVAT